MEQNIDILIKSETISSVDNESHEHDDAMRGPGKGGKIRRSLLPPPPVGNNEVFQIARNISTKLLPFCVRKNEVWSDKTN